jgi:hypothetical protein
MADERPKIILKPQHVQIYDISKTDQLLATRPTRRTETVRGEIYHQIPLNTPTGVTWGPRGFLGSRKFDSEW